MDPCSPLEETRAAEASVASATKYFFEEVLRGPMEELRVTAEKWLQLHSRLGETEKANAVARAYALARDRLADTICTASKPELAPAPVPGPAPMEAPPAAAAGEPPPADPTACRGP